MLKLRSRAKEERVRYEVHYDTITKLKEEYNSEHVTYEIKRKSEKYMSDIKSSTEEEELNCRHTKLPHDTDTKNIQETRETEPLKHM